MKKIVWVVGGDLRTYYVIDELTKNGFSVFSTGIENVNSLVLTKKEIESKTPRALLLPISGISEPTMIGDIYLDETFFSTKRNAHIFSGIATNYLQDMQTKYNLKITYLNEEDSFNQVNSIATAEAVVKLIIDFKKKVFSDTTIMVLGYGKSGSKISDLLTRLDAKVIVVERNEQKRVIANEIVEEVYNFITFKDALSRVDILVNTVPSLVVTSDVIDQLNKGTYILDIASSPGGVDFTYAKLLGMKADLALKLPSIYAPLSSSKAIVTTILKELKV